MRTPGKNTKCGVQKWKKITQEFHIWKTAKEDKLTDEGMIISWSERLYLQTKIIEKEQVSGF